MPGDLEFRPITDADEAQVLSLLQASLTGGPTGARSSEFFDWKHRKNPFGPSPGMVAVDGDVVVGLRLFLRWSFVRGDKSLTAVRAVDTATHPDYQRRGIFSRLTTGLLEQLEQAGDVDLVFNTPNAESRPAYLRLGWTELGTLPVRISPVRPVRFARGLRAARGATAAGDATAVTATSTATTPALQSPLPPARSMFDRRDQLQSLIAGAGEPEGWHTPQTLEYLHWRYAQPPGLDYRCVPVERRGVLLGVGFGRLRRRAGLNEFTLGDVLVRKGDTRTAGAVLRAARRSGADHVSVHVPPQGEVAKVAPVSGYLKVPGQGIRLFANPRTAAATDTGTLAHWSLSLGDLEVF